MRAVTPDTSTTSDLAGSMGDIFAQVWRALAGEAIGPDAFTLLLHLLDDHFQDGDTGVGCAMLQNSGVSNVTLLFVLQSGVSGGVDRDRQRTRFCPRGEDSVEGGAGARERAVTHLDVDVVPWSFGNGTEAVSYVGRHVAGNPEYCE